jgi:hypothetical protein
LIAELTVRGGSLVVLVISFGLIGPLLARLRKTTNALPGS